MKKRIELILILFFACTTLLLGILWGNEKNGRDDFLLMAQAGAAEAYARFSEYAEGEDESAYWYGVSAFYTFEQAYHLLTEDTNKHDNYTFCHEVYGHLVIDFEKSQSYMTELVDVMKTLSQNVEDETGYIKMLELRNLLVHN